MFGTYFYNETIKRSISIFGTLFNNIDIKKTKADGTVLHQQKVPISYGPKQKFLLRLTEDAKQRDGAVTSISLPRMAFEMTGLEYDPSRQQNKIIRTQKTQLETTDVGKRGFQYQPAPYNVNFTLSILAKNAIDALQIVEQILPYFQPDYTVTMNDMPDMGIKRDIPVVLTNVGYEDDYQGDFTARRSIIYSLDFTAKFYLYGPVTSSKVIKTVIADQFTDLPDKSPKREQRFTVSPNPITADADDDFGFNETTSFFQDAGEGET